MSAEPITVADVTAAAGAACGCDEPAAAPAQEQPQPQQQTAAQQQRSKGGVSAIGQCPREEKTANNVSGRAARTGTTAASNLTKSTEQTEKRPPRTRRLREGPRCRHQTRGRGKAARRAAPAWADKAPVPADRESRNSRRLKRACAEVTEPRRIEIREEAEPREMFAEPARAGNAAISCSIRTIDDSFGDRAASGSAMTFGRHARSMRSCRDKRYGCGQEAVQAFPVTSLPAVRFHHLAAAIRQLRLVRAQAGIHLRRLADMFGTEFSGIRTAGHLLLGVGPDCA
jgi:hypothetical protein